MPACFFSFIKEVLARDTCGKRYIVGQSHSDSKSSKFVEVLFLSRMLPTYAGGGFVQWDG